MAGASSSCSSSTANAALPPSTPVALPSKQLRDLFAHPLRPDYEGYKDKPASEYRKFEEAGFAEWRDALLRLSLNQKVSPFE